MHPAQGTGLTLMRNSSFRIKGKQYFVAIICGRKCEKQGISETFLGGGLSVTSVEVHSPTEGV